MDALIFARHSAALAMFPSVNRKSQRMSLGSDRKPC
jgi:hypothetical protein